MTMKLMIIPKKNKMKLKNKKMFFFYILQSSQNRLLVKNGKVVNEDGMVDTDVYIEDGIIK